MTTSKLLRAAPPKNLDNYVASSRRLFGEPNSISDSVFGEVNFIAPGQDPNIETNFYTSGIPIGFDIKINERTYSSATIAVSGWLALEGATFFLSDILTGAVYENENIASTFRAPHILLAPWFDQLWPVPGTIDILKTASWYANATQLDNAITQEIKEGINVKKWPFSLSDRGVRYHRGYDKNFGRYFLCRWTTAKRYILDHGRMKFEVALFENGRIEFRYWPNFYYEKSTAVPATSVDFDATVGIFYNYPAGYKFRDFAPLLDYNFNDLANQRKISEFGGSKYDIGYSDAGSPYSTRIRQPQWDLRGRWPNNGSVIVFSPPVNSYKVLPNKSSKEIVSSKNIVRSHGLYDDRRSIHFSSRASIIFPTALPNRLLGDTGDVDVSLRQSLFSSGALQVNGRVKKSSIDTMLEQIEGTSHSFYKKDNSFNEFYKDYKVLDPSQAFFATGSKLEIFGEGFTSPLKSKTHFHLSLPIQESTVLPATRSCIVYYNGERKKWENIDDDGWRKPEAISIDAAPPNVFPYEMDKEFYHRATETARAFDAVGRKITLSSKRNNIPLGSTVEPTYQRDDIIGLIVNTDDPLSQSKLNEALTREYPESFTDSPDYLSSKSQSIAFPIDYPFLIEKIVVEFPFQAGKYWFDDRTTCIRPKIGKGNPLNSPILDEFAGPVDFGGPGLTFSIHCSRKSLDFFRSDLISSGTITHQFDNVRKVLLRPEKGGSNWSLRPEGFTHFSDPTTVLYPTDGYNFTGSVRLEMESAVSSGITYSRNERRPDATYNSFKDINRKHAVDLLTKSTVFITGKDVDNNPYTQMSSSYNFYDIYASAIEALFPGLGVVPYNNSSPRILVHEIHPLSRGSTGISFNGNSILGGTISSVPTKSEFRNQLIVARSSGSLATSYKNEIDHPDFRFDAVSLYSSFTSKPAPYLIMPGEKLTFAISKTRPVIQTTDTNVDLNGSIYHHTGYELTGSHSGTILSAGSLEVTVYGSYVREGTEYHP